MKTTTATTIPLRATLPEHAGRAAHGPRSVWIGRAALAMTLSATLAMFAACTTANRTPDGPVIGGAQAVRELAPPELPLKPNPQYANFPRYTGTLGKRPIEMRLGAKDDDPTGVHGEYQFLDAGSGVILVAGDLDNGTLEIEESNDGTHITGNWVGKVAADGSIGGERMNPDDSNPQSFDLQPANAAARHAHAAMKGTQASPDATPAAAPGAGAPQAPDVAPSPSAGGVGVSAGVPAASPAARAVPTPSNRVGGVSNLTIGD